MKWLKGLLAASNQLPDEQKMTKVSNTWQKCTSGITVRSQGSHEAWEGWNNHPVISQQQWNVLTVKSMYFYFDWFTGFCFLPFFTFVLQYRICHSMCDCQWCYKLITFIDSWNDLWLQAQTTQHFLVFWFAADSCILHWGLHRLHSVPRLTSTSDIVCTLCGT